MNEFVVKETGGSVGGASRRLGSVNEEDVTIVRKIKAVFVSKGYEFDNGGSGGRGKGFQKRGWT